MKSKIESIIDSIWYLRWTARVEGLICYKQVCMKNVPLRGLEARIVESLTGGRGKIASSDTFLKKDNM
ncbi:MAG: hypothetical protein L0229_13035 [Blastocatellia bacterium]|nr:hypothetical protein [Blastocatellia bacterium]